MGYEIAHPTTGELIELREGMSIEDWTEYGRSLFAAEKKIGWAIADWWAFGERRYGDRAKLAAEGVFGKSFQTLANAASAAKAFPEAYRQQEVSLSFHQEAAPLARENPEAAQALLQRAADEGLTQKEVRAQAKALRQPLEDPPVISNGLSHEGWVRRLVTYWNRASQAARDEFLDLVEDADRGIIEL